MCIYYILYLFDLGSLLLSEKVQICQYCSWRVPRYDFIFITLPGSNIAFLEKKRFFWQVLGRLSEKITVSFIFISALHELMSDNLSTGLADHTPNTCIVCTPEAFSEDEVCTV